MGQKIRKERLKTSFIPLIAWTKDADIRYELKSCMVRWVGESRFLVSNPFASMQPCVTIAKRYSNASNSVGDFFLIGRPNRNGFWRAISGILFSFSNPLKQHREMRLQPFRIVACIELDPPVVKVLTPLFDRDSMYCSTFIEKVDSSA